MDVVYVDSQTSLAALDIKPQTSFSDPEFKPQTKLVVVDETVPEVLFVEEVKKLEEKVEKKPLKSCLKPVRPPANPLPPAPTPIRSRASSSNNQAYLNQMVTVEMNLKDYEKLQSVVTRYIKNLEANRKLSAKRAGREPEETRQRPCNLIKIMHHHAPSQGYYLNISEDTDF
ncbi:hypothetical protein pv_306 [Pithovirus sibericum]|uniref:Uncharacterized protein n=1 Tax=Pithovirus sibericum TaxID=1450746 RepID=W5S530_9VIRU|nr:hypothetical protein pv_306 [Pithovirus sibericum]AHH01873.1 hypothetical protein pv_306 [Pithovirus sibericum]